MGQARKAPGGEPPMIRVENLWKKFGRFDALRGLSFEVPGGSAFALIGANGGEDYHHRSTDEHLGSDAWKRDATRRRFTENLTAGTCRNRIRLGKPRHAGAADGRRICGLSAAVLFHAGP